MAKKRRLSKRDREIKRRIWFDKRWHSILKDEDFGERLFASIQDIDPTFSGFVTPEGITLKYCLCNDEEIIEEYEVAILTETGALVYSRPFFDAEILF